MIYNNNSDTMGSILAIYALNLPTTNYISLYISFILKSCVSVCAVKYNDKVSCSGFSNLESHIETLCPYFGFANHNTSLSAGEVQLHL